MRVTRDLLINIAHEQAEKLAAKDRSIQCIYLVGSLLNGEEAFLGGVTDIDLVCVHDRPVSKTREILRMNSEVHLDLAHYCVDTYIPPRGLRTNPWLGGTLDKGPLNLYDRFHWFDFTRASASALFWNTENTIARARYFSTNARQTWQKLMDENPQGLKRTQLYLESLSDTANSLAIFSGTPLTTRRFILDLPERISRIDVTEFTGSFVSLFANESVDDAHLLKWREQWLASYDSLKTIKEAPVKFAPTRRSYYEKAVEVLSTDHPAAALWIILTTWTEIAALLPKTETLYREWQSFIRALDLDSKGMTDRIHQLDAQLDLVETFIDQWQEKNS
jgi:hypothetical protein